MSTSKIAGVEVSTDHFIDGKRVASKRTFANCSPIDGKHLADVSAGGESADFSQRGDVKNIAALKGSFAKEPNP